MDDTLANEIIEKMMPALNQIAGLISNSISIDSDNLRDILVRCGIKDDVNALQEIKIWYQLLLEIPAVQENTEKKASIILALQARGIAMAPATLAAENATYKPLICDKDVIDFGLLKCGQSAQATLKVSGYLKQAFAVDKILNLVCTNTDSNETLVKVILPTGHPGKIVHDKIILQSNREELTIPVTAQWEKESPIAQNVCVKCGMPIPAGSSLCPIHGKFSGAATLIDHSMAEDGMYRGKLTIKPIQNLGTAPKRLQICKICKSVGTRGEGSLFFNSSAKRYECLNPTCHAFGPSPDKLFTPPLAFINELKRSKKI